MTTHVMTRLGRQSIASAVMVAAAATGLAACGSVDTATAPASATHSMIHTAAQTRAQTASDELGTRMRTHALKPSEVALSQAMRGLWDQHMEWTYATIAAFATGSTGFQPTVDRLLQNQTDLGNAIKPYYGEKAGTELSALLRAHILGYVPVLTAAKAGDTAGVDAAFAKVQANGAAIAALLHQANPENWPASAMEDMMAMHNEQTLTYAALQLQGKYAQSITEYDMAEAHMRDMADMLTTGIIAQFPNKFPGTAGNSARIG